MAKSKKSSNSSIDTLAKSTTKKPTSPFITTLVVFVITLLIVWFIIYAFRPIFIQEVDSDGIPTGRIQPGKGLGIAFGVAIVMSIITYVIIVMMAK